MGHCYSPERCFFKTVKPGFLSAAASLVLVPIAAIAQPQVDPLAEPLTRDELKPTYFAIVECARRNQEPGCRAARELADELMDRPFVTALCKGKEDPIPVYGQLDDNQPDDNKINILDLLN